jgi:hypothetical protein
MNPGTKRDKSKIGVGTTVPGKGTSVGGGTGMGVSMVASIVLFEKEIISNQQRRGSQKRI